MPVDDLEPKTFARTGTTTIPRPPSPVFAIPTPIAHNPTRSSSWESKFKV